MSSGSAPLGPPWPTFASAFPLSGGLDHISWDPFDEILRVRPVPWLFFAQIKVLNDLLPGPTIPFLSRKSSTGVGGAGCPLPGWGCRGEVARWISAESCLVGEGHRKGAVLKALAA